MHTPRINAIPHHRVCHRGAALLLVLFALVIATVLALTFANGSATSVAIARNVDRHAQARAIAESGLEVAMRYIQTDADWRTNQAHGDWLVDESFGGGTFTIRGEDADGDLTDDASDIVRLIAIGTFDGVSHRVEAEVTPGTIVSPGNLLFVVANASSLNDSDSNKRDLFQSWGYTVTLLSDNASSIEFNTALAGVDVVYVSETVYSSIVGTKLSNTQVGVVSEEGYLSDELGISSWRSTYSSDEVDVVDTTHSITSSFSAGLVTIANANISLYRYSGTVGAGVAAPVERLNSSHAALAVLDTGDTDYRGNASPGRRVMLPWGPTNYGFDRLNDAGRTLVQRALEWAAASGNPTGWLGTDVGSPIRAGSDSSVAGEFTIQATGTGIWGGSDEFRFVYQMVSGDSELIARVTAVPNTHDYAKAGVMIRETLDHNARNAFMTLTGGEGPKFQRRTSTGSWSSSSDGGSHSEPYYVRIQRVGNVLRGFISATGSDGTWTQVGPDVTLSGLAEDVYIGLAATSRRYWTLGTAKFDNVTLTGGLAESDEGPTPNLIALYEFEPVTVTPTLIGHWKLDELLSNGGGGMAADDSLELRNNVIVDSYDGSAGVYGGTNVGSQASLSTNSTSSNRFDVKTDATLNGHAMVGVGGDPDSVIDHDGTITGSKGTLTSNVPMPGFGEPTGMPSTLGNTTYSSDQTWTTDLRFGRLTIRGNAEITVSGNVRIYCTNTFRVEDNAKIIVPEGSNLTIYVDRNIQIKNYAVVNGDSSGTDRLKIVQIASNKNVTIEDNAVVAGVIQSARDITVRNNAIVYGSLIADDDIYLRDHSRIHLDVSLPTLGAAVTPAVDQIAANDGTYVNGTTAGSTGNGLGGTAANFDGSNDYIEIPHSDAYLLDQGAVSLWFRADSLSGRQELFSKDSMHFGTGGHLTIYLNGSRLETQLQSSTASYSVSQSGLQTGAWYHAVFTWGPGGMELFLDGAPADSEDYTGGLGAGSGGIGNYEPIALGGNTSRSGDGAVTPIQDHFDGRIDDVRLFDTRLNASQAAEIQSGSAPSAAISPVVVDTSSYGEALDLAIGDADAVSWIGGGGLDITADVVIASTLPATKLYGALSATDEYAIEVVFTPANITQEGPAGIASYSSGTSSRNFTVGQDDDQYLHRLRTTDTAWNGTPDIVSGQVLAADQQEHLILSFKDEQVAVYRNGSPDISEARTGDLGDWDSTMRFVLANEIGGGRPWHGKLHRVAIYDRGFNMIQAANVFAGGEPGDGAGESQAFKVVWDENP